MAHYMEYSTRIYSVYMKYVAPEDRVVYSIDEVFMDVTDYLNTYKLSPHDLAMKIILDVVETTGITATAGIGTNLFLCKVAMDIVAKHIPADENGVRVAELDEMTFRKTLWKHQPLTTFGELAEGMLRSSKKMECSRWRCCPCSVNDEDKLYKLFGKNAELLIDHAGGWEPCTIAAIKAYNPSTNRLGSGQVLHCPYKANKAKLVLREMADLLVLDLVSKGLVTDQIVVTVGYDIENLTDPVIKSKYHGEITKTNWSPNHQHAHGTINLDGYYIFHQGNIICRFEMYDRL
jgi:DNA polymerase V